MTSRFIQGYLTVRFPSPKMEHTLTELGFAVVGDYQDEAIEKAQSSAFEQMLAWLGAH